MASLFPLFLKLERRHCLVIGAGTVAAQKIASLLESRAEVLVVAPQAGETVRKLAGEGRLRWARREFEPADLEGMMLVISATADRELNAQVFRLATERGILCNAVDEPENCNFYYPSVVRRGDLQIAISTNGRSPALAQRLRKELEQELPEVYASWVEWLGKVRLRLFRRGIEPRCRANLLHRAASGESYQRYLSRKQGEVAG